MPIYPPDIAPELVERFSTGGGALARKMGIEMVELSADYSVATMPVHDNTQVVGILHGGAYVVLGESLGSWSAAIHGGPDKIAVGIEINATHVGSVSEGVVTGVCRAKSLGRTLCTHEIEISDEEGRLLSIVRMTNFLKTRR